MPAVVIYAFEKPGDFNNLLYVCIYIYSIWKLILFSVCVCVLCGMLPTRTQNKPNSICAVILTALSFYPFYVENWN